MYWLDQNSNWSIFGMLITCCYGSIHGSIPVLCILRMAYLTSSGGKYQLLMGVFSEHPCFTGNSASSEHRTCFHYFGLAQPTTDKQIEERTRRRWSGDLLNIYLFLSVSFTVIPVLPCQRHQQCGSIL